MRFENIDYDDDTTELKKSIEFMKAWWLAGGNNEVALNVYMS